jgi:hypothetical protein
VDPGVSPNLPPSDIFFWGSLTMSLGYSHHTAAQGLVPYLTSAPQFPVHICKAGTLLLEPPPVHFALVILEVVITWIFTQVGLQQRPSQSQLHK